MLHVDSETSVDIPNDDRPSSNGYGSSGIDVSRMNPTLWEIETDPETGIPEMGDNDEPIVFLDPATTEFATVSAGHHHACGATAAGGVWCWHAGEVCSDGTLRP